MRELFAWTNNLLGWYLYQIRVMCVLFNLIVSYLWPRVFGSQNVRKSRSPNTSSSTSWPWLQDLVKHIVYIVVVLRHKTKDKGTGSCIQKDCQFQNHFKYEEYCLIRIKVRGLLVSYLDQGVMVRIHSRFLHFFLSVPWGRVRTEFTPSKGVEGVSLKWRHCTKDVNPNNSNMKVL